MQSISSNQISITLIISSGLKRELNETPGAILSYPRHKKIPSLCLLLLMTVLCWTKPWQRQPGVAVCQLGAERRHWLKGKEVQFLIWTNHKNLSYLQPRQTTQLQASLLDPIPKKVQIHSILSSLIWRTPSPLLSRFCSVPSDHLPSSLHCQCSYLADGIYNQRSPVLITWRWYQSNQLLVRAWCCTF